MTEKSMTVCMEKCQNICVIYIGKTVAKEISGLEKKPIIFFHNTDYADPYDIDSDIIVVRSSINRSTMGVSDIVKPTSIFHMKIGKDLYRKKNNHRFCGFPYIHIPFDQRISKN